VGLLDRLLEPIIAKIKEVFAPFGKLIDFVAHFWTSITGLGGKIRDLINLVISEVNEWKNFKENIAFRTRVINVKSAIEHVQEFIQQIAAAWRAIQELVQQLKSKFETTGDPAQEAREAIDDIENSGFRTIFEKFPKLLRGLEKVLGFVAIVLDALESIITAVDDLTTIVNALKTLREDIETGGPLFLKQSNTRRTVTLEDGTKMKIRVGSLHS
jgi:hypothetical protein